MISGSFFVFGEFIMSGILYIVGTPIGNLSDMTFRGVEVLKTVDIIAAEDTRNTKKLLNHFEISTALISYHEHNKIQKGEYILDHYLLNDRSVALVSDAGMPMISDPGFELISLCLEHGVEVTTVPGATAFVSAAILSDLVKGPFVFEGFLPSDKGKRKEILYELLTERRPVILYEAPHRLLRTLTGLQEVLGPDRRVALCRELTKLHEEILRLRLFEATEHYTRNAPKGEFVIVLEGADERALKEEAVKRYSEIELDEHMKIYLDKGLERKEAMKLVAKDRGMTKKEIYKLLLE